MDKPKRHTAEMHPNTELLLIISKFEMTIKWTSLI